MPGIASLQVEAPGRPLKALVSTRRPPLGGFLRCCTAVLCATALSSSTGCHRQPNPSEGISIEESITPQPVRAGAEVVAFRLTNPDGSPLSGAHVRLEGDMNHPGMAPMFADATETSPGNYRAPIEFSMGGDWVLLFHVALADGRRIEKQIDVKGVASR